jgi:hypothetical protein
VFVAVSLVVDHRVEVDERVVAGGIAVTSLGRLGLITGVERRMTAGGRLAIGVVPHVLLVVVGLPVQSFGRQLRPDVGNRGREHAAGAGLDAAGQRPDADDVVEDLAVGLVLDVGRLARDDRDVVVVALVPGRVVVLQEGALLGKRARQVGVAGGIAERRCVVLVLQHDHEHVPHRGLAKACRLRAADPQTRAAPSMAEHPEGHPDGQQRRHFGHDEPARTRA